MARPKEALVPTTPHVEGDEDIGEIRDIVGFHIRLAHGAVYRHFVETFTDLDLTQPAGWCAAGVRRCAPVLRARGCAGPFGPG